MAHLVDLRQQQERLRQELNLKNLRRHDKTISEVVDSTPFASVYRNDGDGWVKTNVEGPMFLFTRTREPSNGFFILNRNGLEYVQEFIKHDSEVRMEGDFILFEPSIESTNATGIWVYDEKERAAFFSKMEAMKAARTKVQASAAAAAPTAKTISLDDLFGSLPAPSPSSKSAVPKQSAPTTAGSLLDSLFADAGAGAKQTQQPAPVPTTSAPAKAKDAGDLLAMIGVQGGGGAISRAAAVAQPESAASSSLPKPNFAGPLLSHDVFDSLPLPGQPTAVKPSQADLHQNVPSVNASMQDAGKGKSVFPMSVTKQPQQQAAAQASQPQQQQQPKQPVRSKEPMQNGHATTTKPVVAPAPTQNGHAVKTKPAPAQVAPPKKNVTEVPAELQAMLLPVVDSAVTTARVGLDGSVASGEPVGRDEFVRSIEGLLKDPTFTRSLYARYLRRFAEECEK